MMYGGCESGTGTAAEGGAGPFSAAILIEVEDFSDGLVNASHERCRELGQRALHKTTVIDCTKLIDQQIQILSQASSCRHS